MIRRFREWRRERAHRCRVDEEWCGLFIGRRYCRTHGVRWDPGERPCPGSGPKADSAETRRKRDECIALESAMIVSSSIASRKRWSYGGIADAAIAKVDEWEARGDLEVLHGTWTIDPEGLR